MRKGKQNLDDRIRAALSNGPLYTYDLAEILWPCRKCPKAWRYQSNGGPPGWVLPLGKSIKSMSLAVSWDSSHRKIVGLR